MLSQHTLVDISRCALTTIHYPEQRTLTADEPAAEPLLATMQHLAATAGALLAGGGHRWQTSAAAVQACDISASSDGHHQSAADPTAAVRDPSSNQADSSSHMTEGFSHPGVMTKEGQQSEEHVVPVAVRHHAAGYDPVWMLLWAVKVTLVTMISTVTMVSTVTMSRPFPWQKTCETPSPPMLEAAVVIHCHMMVASLPVWRLVQCLTSVL